MLYTHTMQLVLHAPYTHHAISNASYTHTMQLVIDALHMPHAPTMQLVTHALHILHSTNEHNSTFTTRFMQITHAQFTNILHKYYMHNI
jgi:hypothetical protein